MKRRDFLKSVAVLPIAAVLPTVAVAAPVRCPYVEVGESVSSIIWHLWDDPRNPAPTGPLFVGSIGDWDGVGYPIVLYSCGWHVEDRKHFYGFYDHEWSNLRRDVPDRFWHDRRNVRRYPNVHAYVREQRFGEHPRVMRKRMASNMRRKTGAKRRVDLSIAPA